jgi:hypothetical protein
MTWWEYLLPFFGTAIFVIIIKAISFYSEVSDKEYWGSTLQKVEYYEYWETWVRKTCTERYACGTDSKGNTQYCTRLVDCSECEEHPAYWKAYDDQGNDWRVDKATYTKLQKQWKSRENFVEMDRDIDDHGRCGQDGDMFFITWDKNPLSSENSTFEHSYKNKVQASRSTFNYSKVTKKEAEKAGLYDYPDVSGETLRQNSILGLDRVTLPKEKEGQQLMEYFNGYHGPKDKARVFVLLFNGNPMSIAKKQEAYWIGGNKNELVICIGLQKNTDKISWVYPFSWTDNKRILVDTREDIANMKNLDLVEMSHVLDNVISGNFRYKEFEDFDYLTVDTPRWALWTSFCIAVFLSLGISWWSTTNEYEEEESFMKSSFWKRKFRELWWSITKR